RPTRPDPASAGFLFRGTLFAAPCSPCRPDPVGTADFCNVFHKETRMEKRILAVLIAAAWAGAAYAQTYQTDRNANAGRQAQRSTATQTPGATARAGNPPPPSDAYVGSGAGVVATNPFGLCWHGGAEWTPDKAAAPCDMTPRASAPVAPVAKAPEPAPAPEPQALAAAAPAPVIEKISLNTDVLFPFNSAE